LFKRDRLSFPLFFDPDFDARIAPTAAPPPTTTPRAGAARACMPSRAHGDYVTGKAEKVFPELGREVKLAPGT
jgi:isopenicillin N synthase-like dioxygenase